jgi:hypothetical protein
MSPLLNRRNRSRGFVIHLWLILNNKELHLHPEKHQLKKKCIAEATNKSLALVVARGIHHSRVGTHTCPRGLEIIPPPRTDYFEGERKSISSRARKNVN